MPFTRKQFQQACHLYIQSTTTGWSWNVHPTFPDLGYLARDVTVPKTLKTHTTFEADDCYYGELEDIDLAVASVANTQMLTCVQYVVYSPTFQVPAFYLTLHDNQGAPLILDDILQTSLFRLDVSNTFEQTTFALTEPNATFPLLSQGDHPILGTPCWYFHPCHTSTAVDELVTELKGDEWSEDEMLLQWIKAWFLVLGTVVNV